MSVGELAMFGKAYDTVGSTNKNLILQTNEIKDYSTKKTLYLKEIDVEDNYYKRIVKNIHE